MTQLVHCYLQICNHTLAVSMPGIEQSRTDSSNKGSVPTQESSTPASTTTAGTSHPQVYFDVTVNDGEYHLHHKPLPG